MLATTQFRIFSSSRLLSENLNFKIQITIILPVGLYGCETWYLSLKEGRTSTLRVSEQGAEENISTEGRGSNWRMEKSAQ